LIYKQADTGSTSSLNIRIRIGLNCANVLVGNVGSSKRLSYTVMGDGVNVAARLEGMNKIFGTTICISDSVFEAVGPEIVARPLRRVQVKGRKHEFMIYELLGVASSDDPELEFRAEDGRLSDMTWVASKLCAATRCSGHPQTPQWGRSPEQSKWSTSRMSGRYSPI
jgi:hypothetical protein